MPMSILLDGWARLEGRVNPRMPETGDRTRRDPQKDTLLGQDFPDAGEKIQPGIDDADLVVLIGGHGQPILVETNGLAAEQAFAGGDWGQGTVDRVPKGGVVAEMADLGDILLHYLLLLTALPLPG